MGTTANGLPWPEGTDFVVDGDDAIRELAEALDPHIGAYYAYARRADSGQFGSGSMTTLLNVSGPLPAGVYLITWAWKLSNSATATLYLRGQANGVNRTSDDTVGITTLANLWSITQTVEHAGGTFSALVAAQVSGGTCSALPGSRITISRIGVPITPAAAALAAADVPAYGYLEPGDDTAPADDAWTDGWIVSDELVELPDPVVEEG